MIAGTPFRVLCTHRGRSPGTPDGHQARGFFVWQHAIESKAGCTLALREARDPAAICDAVREHRPDVLLLFPDWRWPADTAVGLCRELRAEGVRIVFVDYYAPVNSPHFAVLPHVDFYVKRQMLRDRSGYHRELVGGTPFTDYLHNHLSIDCAGWGFRSVLDANESQKLIVGWNLGVNERYYTAARWTRRFSLAWRARPYELNARLGLTSKSATGEWYERYRTHCCTSIQKLSCKPRMPGFSRVGERRYFAELLMSRTVLSPFGWGEVCFRDYEAVAAGCLLLKPSMDHVETEPDIYRAGETYVPLRWDLADLEEKLEWIRAHPGESRRIIQRAQGVLCAYFEQDRFTDLIVSLLRRIPLTRPGEGERTK